MRRAQVEQIVHWWIPRLGLDHWRIDVVWDHSRDEAPSFDSFEHAFTWRARDYDEARMYFNPNEMEHWDRRQANEIVVHELLHLVTRDIEFVLDQIEDQLHRDVETLVTVSHRHAVEGAVDRLSKRIVELVELADQSAPL